MKNFLRNAFAFTACLLLLVAVSMNAAAQSKPQRPVTGNDKKNQRPVPKTEEELLKEAEEKKRKEEEKNVKEEAGVVAIETNVVNIDATVTSIHRPRT